MLRHVTVPTHTGTALFRDNLPVACPGMLGAPLHWSFTGLGAVGAPLIFEQRAGHRLPACWDATAVRRHRRSCGGRTFRMAWPMVHGNARRAAANSRRDGVAASQIRQIVEYAHLVVEVSSEAQGGAALKTKPGTMAGLS